MSTENWLQVAVIVVTLSGVVGTIALTVTRYFSDRIERMRGELTAICVEMASLKEHVKMQNGRIDRLEEEP